MTTRDQKAADPRTRDKAKEAAPISRGSAADGSCRCKETAEMNPRQLLGRMLSDLAFWKKTKKG